MEHVIRAEYEEGETPGARDAQVHRWHMVRGDSPTAMCGTDISPDAATQDNEAWGTDAAKPFCSMCGALFIREVP